MPLTKTRKKVLSSPDLVIGLGASAGGIEALQALLGAVPQDSTIAFVIVLHLDPAANTLLSETISKFTTLPVVEAESDMGIQQGHVYVIPGHHTASLKQGIFHIAKPEKAESWRNPIDKLFYSLARDQGDKAVGVILSGNGNDGALGVKEISKAGGMTLAQAPATAKHDEMPQNAIETGAVDHVLSPVNLTEELLAYAEHMSFSGKKEKFEALHAQVENLLPEICAILLEVTGHNFKHYKISTLSRRIQRRIQVLRTVSAQEYIQMLKKDEAEVRRLFNDLLIGVTSFFRDPDAFQALADEILPSLFKDKKSGDMIRIWVPGCSTGEEAYTLAMLVYEQMEKIRNRPEVQIFATDIDEESLAIARQGAYPHTITTELSQERLKKFFVKKAQHYHVSKEVRGLVLFSVHNLINDPPFSKLDLISCRNLLIYLGSHLQKKLIPLFHYALRQGGYLFLGPSENLSSHRELFKPINAKHRISQRLPTAVRAAAILTERSGTPSLIKPPNVASSSDSDTYLLMQRIVLDEFAPKALVIDEEGQIVCASGNLEKYVTVSAGAFHNNAMRMVKEGLRVGLRTTLAEAVRQRRQITHDALSLRTKDGMQRIMLTVQPMPQMGDDSGLFMVVFQDVGLPLKEEAVAYPTSEKAGALIEQLERELLNTREDLERTVQDLEAVNEEIKSSNEELLSMNEELQSANEELETSKEEVQLANDNLNRANEDLENLLVSTQIATIFLDEQMHVRRVTPAITSIYNILPSDTGRPLTHFTHKAKLMPALPSNNIIHTASIPFEHEVEMHDGSWYLRRVVPYRTEKGGNEGIVIMFTEITSRKRAELALRKSDQQLRLAISASKLGIWRWDPATDEIDLSPRGAEIFGISVDEPVSRSEMRTKLLGKVHQEATLDALNRSLADKTDYNIEYQVTRPDGTQVWVQAIGAGDYDLRGNLIGMNGVLKDITEEKIIREQLINSEQLYRGIGESINYGIWVCDANGRNTYASDSFLKLVGLTQQECSDSGWSKVLHPDDLEATMKAWEKCTKDGSAWDREHRFKGVDGQWHSVLARGVPVKNDKGVITGWVGINLDISLIKLAQMNLRESEERFRMMADSAPVLIWISDTEKRRTWFNKPWREFTGRTLEQDYGKGWTEIIHPDDRKNTWQKFSDATDKRASFRMEYRLKRHDGIYRWMMSSGIPMYDENEIFLGYIGSVVDISDHKAALESLQDADRRKDEFLAMLAHELRNPLAPISNGLQVMRMAASKPELLSQMQDVMERQVTHMVRLIDDLLDVSRITRGSIEIQKTPVDIQSVVSNAVEISRPLIDSKKHAFAVDVPEVPLFVMGDMTRLSQIVANLLNNAAKYTPQGGNIKLKVVNKDGKMLLSIKDNGLGIPTNMLDKIFEIFVQVDTALDRSEGGLGIGLTLVRKLVILHGGKIEVKSAGPGKGSEFTISVPVYEAK